MKIEIQNSIGGFCPEQESCQWLGVRRWFSSVLLHHLQLAIQLASDENCNLKFHFIANTKCRIFIPDVCDFLTAILLKLTTDELSGERWGMGRLVLGETGPTRRSVLGLLPDDRWRGSLESRWWWLWWWPLTGRTLSVNDRSFLTASGDSAPTTSR